MQQGSNGSNSAGATAMLTDEQILDMDLPETQSREPVVQVPLAHAATPPESFRADRPEAGGEGTIADRAARRSSPAAEDGARGQEENLTPRESSASDPAGEPAWLKALEAQPEAAAQAREWRAAAQDVAAIDAAYFSTDANARSGLASRLYESDPAAFRAMLSESARVLAARDPQALAQLAQQLGAAGSPIAEQASAPSRSIAQASRDAGSNSQGASNFPVEAYRAFEMATNTEVARRMNDAIDRTLRATLPEGVADGARRRIGDDISREIHAALANDRALTQQVSDALRDWRFDASAQQRVVTLLAGRARAVLPDVARRVVSEWTSSVLASDRARNARIDAAVSRREITGGRLPEPVAAGALRPRDIDYGRVTDEQILEM